MQRVLILSASIAMTTWGAGALADSPKLKGDYGFTGSATCIQAGGFNPNLTAMGYGPLDSFAVEGVRTFNGDGTGSVTGKSMGVFFIPPPLGGPFPSASANDFTFSFTYTINGDGAWTSEAMDDTITGNVTAGPRQGQKFMITNFPIVTGQISQSASSLTAATLTPTPETVLYKDAMGNPAGSFERICNRSRVLINLSNGQ